MVILSHLSSFHIPEVDEADGVGYHRACSRFPHPHSAYHAEPRNRAVKSADRPGEPLFRRTPHLTWSAHLNSLAVVAKCLVDMAAIMTQALLIVV